MLFRKKSDRDATVAFPGIPVEASGWTAAVAAARQVADVAGAYPSVPDEAMPVAGETPRRAALRAVDGARALVGLVAGWAATGLRAEAITQGAALAEMTAALAASVARRLPYVVQVTCAPEGDHDAYVAASGTGLFQLFAATAQEAADYPLIAHRIAELALNPGLCAYDGVGPATVRVPEPALVAAYLGAPDDRIACPTPAQAILYGDHRRRLPALVDLDRPLGVGAALDRSTAFRARAAQQTFFFDHLPALADRAMAEFGELTGRHYARAAGYRLDDAAYVVVAQGAIVEALRAVADHLRAQERIKVGVLNLAVLRPFPGDLVSTLLRGRQAVTVLERTHRPLAEDRPLLREIRSAVDKAVENGLAGAPLPYPDHAVYAALTDRPRFFSGAYGRDAAPPSFDDLCAVVRNMQPNGPQKRSYYLGVRFDRSDVRLPKLQRLQQLLRQGYPDLDAHTLATDDPARGAPPAPEPEAPWTVRQVARPDGTVYDLGRFWDSVGYLYATGHPDEALADPFVATETMPARSSAFRSLAPTRSDMPRLIPERCTACGTCWTYCPDAALPVTVQDVGALVETAVARAEAAGPPLLHMPRLGKHLVQQAHRLVAKNDLQPYLTLGALLTEAFERLMDRMAPDDEQRTAFADEFARVHGAVATFPIVKTETFFDAPERAEKGTGLLFSLVVNPDSCKACGLCTAVCPEEALEMVAQTGDVLADARAGWDVLRDLPDVPATRIAPFLAADRPETQAYRLLNRRAYHALLGGDASPPGNGVRVALRLFMGAIEAVMQPRMDTLVDEVAGLIVRVEARMRDTVTTAMEINDLAAFSEQLARIDAKQLRLEDLAHLVEGDEGRHVDNVALKRLAAARDALQALLDRYRRAAHGDGRARVAIAVGAGETMAWLRTYPYNPFPFPWIHHPSGDAAALAEGVFEGVMRTMAADVGLLRRARLLADDTYDPAVHEPVFEALTWSDFTPEEWALCPPLVVVADDEAQVARLLQVPLPVKVLLINGQRFEPEALQDDPGLWALAHRHVFVVQASIGYPGRLVTDVLEGMAYKGPALFHVYAPDPERHGLAPEQVVQQAQRAVRSRAFPLFTCRPHGLLEEHLDLDANPDVPEDWSMQTLMVKAANGLPATQTVPLTVADWAVAEGRFRDAFTRVPRGEASDALTPLAEYLARPAAEREGLTPVIQVTATDGTPVRMIVSPAMVALTEARLGAWRRLLELAGLRSPSADRRAEQARRAHEAALADVKRDLEAAYAASSARQEQAHDQRYHDRLTDRLLALSGYGADAAAAQATLREWDEGRGRSEEGGGTASTVSDDAP